jgi:hypothetical protein
MRKEAIEQAEAKESPFWRSPLQQIAICNCAPEGLKLARRNAILFAGGCWHQKAEQRTPKAVKLRMRPRAGPEYRQQLLQVRLRKESRCFLLQLLTLRQ